MIKRIAATVIAISMTLSPIAFAAEPIIKETELQFTVLQNTKTAEDEKQIKVQSGELDYEINLITKANELMQAGACQENATKDIELFADCIKNNGISEEEITEWGRKNRNILALMEKHPFLVTSGITNTEANILLQKAENKEITISQPENTYNNEETQEITEEIEEIEEEDQNDIQTAVESNTETTQKLIEEEYAEAVDTEKGTVAAVFNSIFVAIQDSVDDVAQAGPGFWTATRAAGSQIMAYLATPVAIAGLAVASCAGAAAFRYMDLHEEYEEDPKKFIKTQIKEIEALDGHE